MPGYGARQNPSGISLPTVYPLGREPMDMVKLTKPGNFGWIDVIYGAPNRGRSNSIVAKEAPKHGLAGLDISGKILDPPKGIFYDVTHGIDDILRAIAPLLAGAILKPAGVVVKAAIGRDTAERKANQAAQDAMGAEYRRKAMQSRFDQGTTNNGSGAGSPGGKPPGAGGSPNWGDDPNARAKVGAGGGSGGLLDGLIKFIESILKLITG